MALSSPHRLFITLSALCLTGPAAALLLPITAVAQPSTGLKQEYQVYEMTDADPFVGTSRVKYFDFDAAAMAGINIVGSKPKGVTMALSLEYLDADKRWTTVLRDDGRASLFGTVQEAGRYRLAVSFLNGATGRFSFTPLITAPAQNIIGLVSSQTGQITLASAGDAALRAQNYKINVKAGQRIKFTAQSDGFKVGLAVKMVDKDGTPLSAGGTGPSTSLDYLAPADGQLLILVLSQGGGTGRYTLNAVAIAPPAAASAAPAVTPKRSRPGAVAGGSTVATAKPEPRIANGGPIKTGESVSGTLASSDLRLSDGLFYDSYKIDLRANEKISVMLASEEFAPRLTVIGPNGFVAPRGETFANDGIKVWQLLFTATVAGTYTIAATAEKPGTGLYAMSIDKR